MPVITVKIVIVFFGIILVTNGCAVKEVKQPENLPPINVNHRYA